MCEILDMYIAKGENRGIEIGKIEMLCSLVKGEVISLKEAVKRSGMSEKEFCEELKK